MRSGNSVLRASNKSSLDIIINIFLKSQKHAALVGVWPWD